MLHDVLVIYDEILRIFAALFAYGSIYWTLRPIYPKPWYLVVLGLAVSVAWSAFATLALFS